MLFRWQKPPKKQRPPRDEDLLVAPVRPFRRLQWRLARSYMLVTILTVLSIEAGLLALFAWYLFFSRTLPEHLASDMERDNAKVAALLQKVPLDKATLTTYLQSSVKPAEGKPQEGVRQELRGEPLDCIAGVLDAQGNLVALYPPGKVKTGVPLLPQLEDEEGRSLITAGQTAEKIDVRLVRRLKSGHVAAAVPVRDPKTGKFLGTSFYRSSKVLSPVDSWRNFFKVIVPSAIVLTLFSGGVGLLFGFMTAKPLVRRLTGIAQTADAWAQGAFTATVPASEDDELGRLADRLNRMARDLEDLFVLRQDVATLEERNRLARDLHDTVKQQVFATAMQVGAARALIARDPVAASERLSEAEKIARQASQELTGLLKELRPVSAGGGALHVLLQGRLTDWSRQTGIVTEFHAGDLLPLGQETTTALLRIVQEALANIAKHSGAANVRVHLAGDRATRTVTLTITDNGKGFDTTRKSEGMGLSSMRERAEALPGGQFSLESSLGWGTNIKVHGKADALSADTNNGSNRQA